ncbi:hypothetical protein G6F68_009533 [Rhizopus microsporus]|nr:hypothetical protein G6F68_009533 [Rhizopus microsporus]
MRVASGPGQHDGVPRHRVLAQYVKAQRMRLRHDRRIRIGLAPGKNLRVAQFRRHIGGIDGVLDAQRHPVQQLRPAMAIPLPRARQRAVGVDLHPGLDAGVAFLDAVQAGPSPGFAGQPALLQRRQPRGGGQGGGGAGRGAAMSMKDADEDGAASNRRAGIGRMAAPPDVQIAHVLIGQQRLPGVGQHDPPRVQDVSPVAEGQRLAGTLLDHQHGHADLRQAAHLGKHLLGQRRRQSGRRLVQHHQPGRRHQRPRKRQLLAFAAGQVFSMRLAASRKRREQLEHVSDALLAPLHVLHHLQVLQHGQRAEHVAHLGHVRDADAHAFLHGQRQQVAAIERHRPRDTRQKPHHCLDQRGLARAVGAGDGDDLVGGHRHVDAADDIHLGIAAGQALHDEQTHITPPI